MSFRRRETFVAFDRGCLLINTLSVIHLPEKGVPERFLLSNSLNITWRFRISSQGSNFDT